MARTEPDYHFTAVWRRLGDRRQLVIRGKVLTPAGTTPFLIPARMRRPEARAFALAFQGMSESQFGQPATMQEFEYIARGVPESVDTIVIDLPIDADPFVITSHRAPRRRK